MTSLAARQTVNAARNIGKLTTANTAFLLCDVQDRFRTIIHKMETVISTSAFLMNAAKGLDIPIVATEQYPKAFGHTVTDLPMENVPVFEKKLFSMVTPEVDLHLKDLGRTHFVLFGIEGHVCVQQTCLDLLEKGHDVHVIVDGVSSGKSLDREVALRRMEMAGAYLTTSQSIIFALLGSASHPKFKEISKLIVEHGKKVNEFDTE